MVVRGDRSRRQDTHEGMERAAREERRRRYRETTMAERLESCLALGELGRELRTGVLRKR